MADQHLSCAWNGCRTEFTWNEGEQKFYEERGFKAPRFCKTHRVEAREARQEKSQRAIGTYHGTNDRELLGL